MSKENSPAVCFYFQPPQEVAHRSFSEGGLCGGAFVSSCYGRRAIVPSYPLSL